MKRLLKYYKEKKGISLVLIALLLAVLFMLAGMAIDISYMYYVKNQLQVAADAATLAGAANLAGGIDDTSVNPNILDQESARQEAWKFACKNRATNRAVFLVTDGGKDPFNPDCDNNLPTAADLNGTATNNNANGDIVVGHWRLTNDVTCSTGWEPAGSGYFCPANGSTLLTINALKARPQRTDESATYGMPKVRVFIGQVFRLIGIDWSYMSARASAIAARMLPQIGPIPICLPSCSLETPLDSQWEYDSSLYDPNNPGQDKYCTDTDNLLGPFGQHFFLNPSSDVNRPGMAWTNFDINECAEAGHTKCNDNPDVNDIKPYLEGTPPPPICNKAICTTNGGMTGPILELLKGEFDKHKGDAHPVGDKTINGWLITVPIVSNSKCGVAGQSCPGDPTARPYLVIQYAQIIVTDVISSVDEGHKGIRLVGLNNPYTKTFSCVTKVHGQDVTVPRTRTVTSIGDAVTGMCPDCNELSPSEGTNIRLVR
jgi:Flp pilus assembly protein TadG